MSLTFKKLHPCFVAEASAVDLRTIDDQATLRQIRCAMDEHAVLVFHDQSFVNDEQLQFAQRLDGKVNMTSATAAVLGKSRIPYVGMIDVSNVMDNDDLWKGDDRKRMHRMTMGRTPPVRVTSARYRTVPGCTAIQPAALWACR